MGYASRVAYPIEPPIAPMLALRVAELPPEATGWTFEPKWDGFRALIFRNGADLFLQSRDGRPLARYFPELLAPLAAQLPVRCVLDGEIVIAGDRGLDFEALQLRLHPAESRVKRLAQDIPAAIVFFDLLALGDRDLRATPFAERRATLERVLAGAHAPLHLTPATADRDVARDWFDRFEGAGLDGVMAKREDGRYEPGKRVMLKVKHERDCDCVVAGFRWHKGSEATAVGSLLLGLFDDAGTLHDVGVCGSFTAARRKELVATLAALRMDGLTGHPWATAATEATRRPGTESRWSQGKDLSFVPLRPERVVEVAYDHMQGRRFRHTAQFRRWRPDKAPGDCTFAQLEVVAPAELAAIFGSPGQAR
jgi:ATP-dependent DNA ligase